MSAPRGIDHLVIAVNDLSAARDRFSQFGFCTTPLGRHPWGTGNHIVQFQNNFIELVGVLDPAKIVPMSDEHFSFSAHTDHFLRRREGMSMLVLSTADAREDAEQWRDRGLHVHEPVHWSRQATLPDGSENTVAFTLSFVTNPLMPEIAFFSCQQHNPEAFWKPQYQVHENGARGIASVTLVADDPAQHAAFFASLVDGATIDERPGALSVNTAHGVIQVLTPEHFVAAYPGTRLSDDRRGAVFMAAGVDVPDLGSVAACLEKTGVAFSKSDSAIQVASDQCCGIGFEFTLTRD